MSAAIILLLILDSPGSPSGASVPVAISQSLGDSTKVEVAHVASEPADDAALARGEAVHASAVVELRWSGDALPQARIRAHLAPGGAWVSRELRFSVASAPAERERAVGLTIASMILAEETSSPPATPTAPAASAPEPPRPAPVTVPSTAPAPLTAPSASAAPSPKPTRDIVAPRPPSTSPSPRIDADLLGVVGGDAAGSGAALGAAIWPWSRFGISGHVEARAGALTSVDATTLGFAATVGGAYSLLAPSENFGFAIKAELGVWWQQVSHDAPSRGPTRLSRTLPLASAWLEADFRLIGALRLLLSAGLQVPLGTTTVVVRDRGSAGLPVLDPLGALGVRFSF